MFLGICDEILINSNPFGVSPTALIAPDFSSFGAIIVVFIQSVHKYLRRGFCLISLAISMLEGWNMIHLKGGIHSSVWSTKTFLYNIREPRYKQNNMGYQ